MDVWTWGWGEGGMHGTIRSHIYTAPRVKQMVSGNLDDLDGWDWVGVGGGGPRGRRYMYMYS